ncbi:hypothetical protein [Bacillus niameyensis]|uniref:hypothetical protein n=1 Tax=Bacillus niameyensis TaxID=1522308 RepID=UPI001E4CC2A0|nr:hypothetical protein [Bacillus niameyensis]
MALRQDGASLAIHPYLKVSTSLNGRFRFSLSSYSAQRLGNFYAPSYDKSTSIRPAGLFVFPLSQANRTLVRMALRQDGASLAIHPSLKVSTSLNGRFRFSY